ncbi:HGGxSTG domain-containing protein [Phenylobacterium sp.]|uniref:HGGxSTG domain-containing protein n=1 Tax=Phenylobacterium sp. TaxID=1871053 RepID=UPI0037C63791
MRGSRRCGARTRKGSTCQAPAVSGKKRCRMHGGATGSGAPKGNTNALKNGMFTKEMKAERARFREMIAESKELLMKIERS